jgi:hypothetical protein
MQVSVVQFRPWAPSTKFGFDSAWFFAGKVPPEKTESHPLRRYQQSDVSLRISCPLLGVKRTLLDVLRCPLLMLWTAPAPRYRRAIVVALKARATKEVKPLPIWELKL